MEKFNNYYESVEVATSKKYLKVCGYDISLMAPFEIDMASFDSVSSDIPSTSMDSIDESDDVVGFDGCVEFVESEQDKLVWSEDAKRLSIFGKVEHYKKGYALIYKGVQVAEYLRQMDGQITTHGSAVRFPNGKAVIIMGNSGAGKTSTAISLCKNYGAELIGNDQVIFDIKDGLKVVGGTKDLIVRKKITQQNFPELAHLFDSKENSWKSKRRLKPADLDINICDEPTEVCAVVWLHLDSDQDELTHMKKIDSSDIVDSLNISERLSRQISGVQSPLIDDSGSIRSFGLSLDNDITRKNRLSAIEKFRETGIYYIFSSKLEDVSESIKHLTEFKEEKND